MSEPRISVNQRARVMERAKGCCEYCQSQEQYSPDPFSVEHIVPLFLGPRTSKEVQEDVLAASLLSDLTHRQK